MLDYRMYKNIILETIDKIDLSMKDTTKDNFLKDSILQDATLMRLQVIGENIKNIPLELKKSNKQIKWKKFEKLRNIISHKYSSVDYNLIWSFIKDNLNELKTGVLSIK